MAAVELPSAPWYLDLGPLVLFESETVRPIPLYFVPGRLPKPSYACRSSCPNSSKDTAVALGRVTLPTQSQVRRGKQNVLPSLLNMILLVHEDSEPGSYARRRNIEAVNSVSSSAKEPCLNKAADSHSRQD